MPSVLAPWSFRAQNSRAFPLCRPLILLLLHPSEAAWIGGSLSAVRRRRRAASSMAAFTLLLLWPVLRLAAGAAGTPSPSSGPHITDLNVLLPPRMTNPVQYRLIGTGGCFSWTWDHHDILHVEPEFNGTRRCSTSARIVSIAPYSGRKETAVYAADLESGTVIRCEVFIDNISRIQIFHHSVKLDLDGFATLKVRAFDSEENVFSSLVGLQFTWQLMSESLEGDHSFHHLAHVPLKETPLTDCGGFCGDLDTQINLEDNGMGSDLYVVKGIEIGHEVVVVRLLEQQFEHVMDKIVLTVAEAMSLYPPSPIFVVIGSLIRYSLRIIRRNNPQAVDLPSSFHRWSVSNSTVAQVDSLMGLARALNLGTTIITVEDTRVIGHNQMSTMHVVLPDKLCLFIMPIINATDPLEGAKSLPSSIVWYVIVGQEYIIHMKVFSPEPNSKEIYITESNMLILESDNSKTWDIFTVSDDMAAKYGWQNLRTFKPLSQGQGYLTASLFYHRGDPEITEVLKGMQQVIVCDKVRVGLEDTMEYLHIMHLPWAPGVHQEVVLKAIGGCARSFKDYEWFSTNPASVYVSASGLIRAKWPGQATIKVTSKFDPMNSDEVLVEVSTPASMVMIQEFPVEAVVGTHLQAAVSLKTSDGIYFDKCDALNSFVKWRVLSATETFLVTNTTRADLVSDVLPHVKLFEHIYKRSCSWTYLYASSPGHAMLHVAFSSKTQSPDLLFGGQIVLHASAPIAAYNPLVAYQSGNGDQFGGYSLEFPRIEAGVEQSHLEVLSELYLVAGTSMDILIIGGPDRWDHDVEHIDTVEVKAGKKVPATGVTWKQTFTGDNMLYNILCQTVGNFNLVFSSGNLVGDNHPLPTISSVEMALTCSSPSSITLIANEHVNTHDAISSSIQAERGPGKVRISPVIVANGRTIRMAAVGVHKSGRPFANSSSLCLRWELNGCQGLAYWVDAGTLEKSTTSWERFLILENASGLCTVRATVTGFSEKTVSSLLEESYLQLEDAEKSLTDAVRLQLVSTLQIAPEKVLLYFHPEAKVNLSIVGGTCFLDAVINDTQVSEIVQPPEGAQCTWLILAARGLGNAVITVYDIGLSPPVGTSAFVKVADVDWIKIISEDEISLMEGTTMPFELLAGTNDGSIFDSSMYFHMDIHLHIEGNALEFVNKEHPSITGNQRIHGAKFLLKAQNLGVATFYVSVQSCSRHEISSQLIKVEVYAPLHIQPDYVFLVPGASYVLSLEGGPTFGSFFEYTSLDDETAIVNGSSGRLNAVSIGNTTIRASVYANGRSLISEAFAKVEVGIPSVMTLHLQSEYLCVGCQMSVFPSFPEGDLFSFYEVCKDYTWSVENEKVLNFSAPQFSRFDHHLGVSSPHMNGQHYSYDLSNEDYGFINMLQGRSEGRTKVSVSFSCVFAGSPQPVYYNASQLLRVVPELPLSLGMPITWVLPPFYTTTDLLPGSAESYGQSDSHTRKLSIMYSLLTSCGKDNLVQQDAIVISGAKVKTRESKSLGCIQAKDEYGRSEVAACVRVAEVAQVRATTKGSSSHVAYMASNDRLEIVISYTDDLGYPFFEAYGLVPLDIVTNYPNVLSIHVPRGDHRSVGRDVLHLQAKDRGVALVRISINHNPKKSIYFLISVGAQLYPMNPVLYVGHVLNFSITGDGIKDLKLGRWFSGNESLISIDRLSGEAHALREGVTQVIFEGPNFRLQTPATVRKMDLVTVNPPEEVLTNVPFPTNGYKFPVQFRNDLFTGISDTNGSGLQELYDCRVDPSFIGYIKPWSDNASGISYCILFPYSPSYLRNSLSKFKEKGVEFMTTGSNGILFVSVIASPKRSPNLSGSACAPFIGGFSVSDNELNLTRGCNKTHITITGNTDVEIHWNLRDELSVKPVQKENVGVIGCTKYEVEVREANRFTDKITIMLPATGQIAEISVSYDDGERSSPEGRSIFLVAAVFMCLILLILTVVIFLRFLERPERPRASEQLHSPAPSVAGSLTPDRRPAHHDSQLSPHTPQPFVEYVRSTVDETPYYKREGRRRFDPQRTY